MRDEDHAGVDRARACPRATRSSRCRGGSSARRGSSRSGCEASARASEARVSSPPEKRRQRPLEIGVGEAEPTRRPRRPGRASRSRRRARAAPARARSGRSVALVVVAGGHPALERAQLVLEADEVGRAGEHVLAQRRGLARRRPLVVQRDAAPCSHASSPPSIDDLAGQRAQQRRLPGSVGPASASRSRRSTLNETPSKSGVPESSLRRLEAVRSGHGRRIQARARRHDQLA